LPRESSIRVRNKDKELIKKLNARVYSKKSRLKKKDLFPDIETKGITEFETRKEFNAYVKEMERFTSRQTQFTRNEKGATLPLGLLENIEKEIERINRQKAKRKEKIGKMQYKFAGEETGVEVRENIQFIQRKKFESLAPLKFDPNRYKTDKELQEHLEYIRKAHKGDFFKKKDILYRDNYLLAIERVHGSESKLYKIVEKMPITKFIHFYYTENLAEMIYVYEETLRNEIHDMLVELYSK
jgi:hypothetical protein